MTWLNPLPLKLLPTSDSESFRVMPTNVTGLPMHGHPGAFGVRRKNHTHEGVDLYAPQGTPVYAVEAGQVVRVAPFTGPKAGLPWWLDTSAVWVEGASGVVLYGELDPVVSVGTLVVPGQLIGHVERVLVNDKGRPLAMLHLELHTAQSREAPEWLVHDERPAVLRDPTPYLMACAAHGLYEGETTPRKDIPMLDFSKLNDPDFQKEVRNELEEKEARRQALVDELKVLADKCEGLELTPNQRSFIRSCQHTLSARLSLTSEQESWLRRLAAKR